MIAHVDNVKRGTLLKLRRKAWSWIVDIKPWDEKGIRINFTQGTIFEFIEANKQRALVWCPQFNCYISNIPMRESDGTNAWFEFANETHC